MWRLSCGGREKFTGSPGGHHRPHTHTPLAYMLAPFHIDFSFFLPHYIFIYIYLSFIIMFSSLSCSSLLTVVFKYLSTCLTWALK